MANEAAPLGLKVMVSHGPGVGFVWFSLYLMGSVQFQSSLGDWVGVSCIPCILPLSPSFQLTVEMFDYMDCELKLSESGGCITQAAKTAVTRLTFSLLLFPVPC